MKTILLTGATGFLGSHLLAKIVKDKTYKIIILKRSFSNCERILNIINTEFVLSYDIDKIDLEEVFKINNIDIIVHCATEYGRNNCSCSKILQSNLIFPVELLELAIKYNVKAFINTDSYFNKRGLSYPYLLNYSLSKKSLELWLEKFSQNIKIANLMLEHIFGEFDNENKFVAQMIKKIAIDKVPYVELTSGKQKRDFIYVKDVCDIYIKVMKDILTENFNYKTIEVGTGKSISIKDFVKLIKKVSSSSTELRFGAIQPRKNEITNSKAKRNKYKYKYTSLEIAIKKILAIEKNKKGPKV